MGEHVGVQFVRFSQLTCRTGKRTDAPWIGDDHRQLGRGHFGHQAVFKTARRFQDDQRWGHCLEPLDQFGNPRIGVGGLPMGRLRMHGNVQLRFGNINPDKDFR
jgi:hypothetical protein